MSFEGVPGGDSLDERFARLSEQAHEQMIRALLERGHEPNRTEAELTADEMFHDRYAEALEVYEEAMQGIAQLPAGEHRREALQLMLEQMALRMHQGGYISEVTGQRLAAVLAEMFAEDEDSGGTDVED